MTTAAPAAPRVEYEERFAARPDLMKAAAAALAYLDGGLGTDPLVPPPSVIRWAIRPLDPDLVELSMADEDDGLRAVRIFPISHLRNPQSRDVHGLRVWGELLSERLRVSSVRLDRKMADFRRKLDEEPE